ncbi:MAG: hypothetical protein KKG99_05615 [Bacteroidetes bacterium]|nr:hypothetical protein [Bacteroidota bacterium]
MFEIKYNYETHDGKDVIFRELTGEITILIIIESFQFLISQKKISKQCVGIITDTTNAKMNVKISELKEIYNYLRKSPELQNIKLAIIVNTPGKTILPMTAMRTFTNIRIQPFSGQKAAIKWILR